MRFPIETCAQIQKAAPHPTTIPWPAGEGEPKPGRVYWLQRKEDLEDQEKREVRRRQHSPETHAEVMEGMRAAWYGEQPKKLPKKRRGRSATRRPQEGDPRIYVIAADVVGEKSFEAKVVLYVDVDPVRHTGLKTKVGPTEPRFEDERPRGTELEPEELRPRVSRKELEEQETAQRKVHAISVDIGKVVEYERSLLERRRQGRPAPIQEQAVERAKRRADDQDAA